MVDERASRRYAAAAYGAAEAAGAVSEVESDLVAISDVLGQDARTRAFFLSPELSREEKVTAFDRAFSSAHPLTKQLFRVLFDKRREELLGGIREEFERLRRLRASVVRATVTSAEPLGDEARSRLEAKLTNVLGRTIEARYSIEPRLVGGVRVEYGGYVLDGSVRGAFRRLRESLRQNPDIVAAPHHP